MKQIRAIGTIDTSKPPGPSRTIRTKATIQKVRRRFSKGKKISERILVRELKTSKTSIHRLLREDLSYRPYKIVKQPALTNEQKINRKRFAKWVQNNFRKDDIRKWLFSDEKFFDIDGVYNSQNDRIWAPSRAEANKQGGLAKKRKFPARVMVWMGACSKGVTPLVILDKDTINHERYINEVLPVALKSDNYMLGQGWWFQQDNATAHTHHLTQKWCKDNLPGFIPKDRWTANSHDLNPLDYCLWDELAQSMDWDQVSSKLTLVDELQRGVKKMRKNVILKSVDDFAKRLFRLLEFNGAILS